MLILVSHPLPPPPPLQATESEMRICACPANQIQGARTGLRSHCDPVCPPLELAEHRSTATPNVAFNALCVPVTYPRRHRATRLGRLCRFRVCIDTGPTPRGATIGRATLPRPAGIVSRHTAGQHRPSEVADSRVRSGEYTDRCTETGRRRMRGCGVRGKRGEAAVLTSSAGIAWEGAGRPATCGLRHLEEA